MNSNSKSIEILSIPADGIGAEVIPVASDLMKYVYPDLSIVEMEAGYGCWEKTGNAIPDEVLEVARTVDGILFGATATPAPPPETYRSPILTLRNELNMSVNIRYCRSPGGKPMDSILIRNSSEGLYIGREQEVENGYIAEHLTTVEETVRLAKEAAKIAKRRSNRVAVVHKANVLKKSEGMFKKIATETLQQEGVEVESALSDAVAYFLIKDPTRYDVLIMNSHVGDILSNVGAAVVGSMGLVPSLTLGDGAPLAEPIHGSATDIAGTGKADPVGAILSGAHLLEELGRKEEAERLFQATYKEIDYRDSKMEIRTLQVVDRIKQYLA